jgi:hypothetical protein
MKNIFIRCNYLIQVVILICSIIIAICCLVLSIGEGIYVYILVGIFQLFGFSLDLIILRDLLENGHKKIIAIMIVIPFVLLGSIIILDSLIQVDWLGILLIGYLLIICPLMAIYYTYISYMDYKKYNK